MKRFFWLLLLVLLVGSFVGAWAVNHSPGSSGPAAPKAQQTDEFDHIFAQGHVDIDKGPIEMYPRQPGLVLKVVSENDKVKKNDVLLQVDDTLAQRDIRAASEDLKAAEAALEEAQVQVKRFPEQLEQQKEAVAALTAKSKQVEMENRIKEKQIGENYNLTQETKTALREGLNQVQALLKVEQAKLKELELGEPAVKAVIRKATAHVAAKKELVGKAEDALELYRVRAPSDGMVLRLLTQEGATLGPSPKLPAIQFRPNGPLLIRAEILQEWGHLVKEGQKVAIEDDTYQSRTWDGEVQTLSSWYAPTRSPIIEPFKMNDVRTLECLIQITAPPARPAHRPARARED
jgi:multidrug resistance efflux pump